MKSINRGKSQREGEEEERDTVYKKSAAKDGYSDFLCEFQQNPKYGWIYTID
jgi:hypothetical protein